MSVKVNSSQSWFAIVEIKMTNHISLIQITLCSDTMIVGCASSYQSSQTVTCLNIYKSPPAWKSGDRYGAPLAASRYHCTGGHFLPHGQKILFRMNGHIYILARWCLCHIEFGIILDIFRVQRIVLLKCRSAVHCLHPAPCPAQAPGIISTVWSAGPAGRDSVTLLLRDIIVTGL